MKLATTLGAFLVAASVASATPTQPDQYRNPTVGRDLVLQIPGMHRAKVRRGFLYRRVGRDRLRLDVYYPRRVSPSRRLPAVLLGGPAFSAGRQSGQKVGWAQLIAASGMAAIAFDTRSDGGLQRPRDPAEDVSAALAFVRSRAQFLRIDPERLCTLGFSIGTAPWHLWATMREPAAFVRCNAVFYGPLDFDDLGPAVGMSSEDAREFSARRLLELHGASIPPTLVVKAGRERNAGINESIDRFAAAAAQRGARVRVLTHRAGIHAFDVLQPSAPSRALINQALAFMKRRLSAPTFAEARKPPPLRLQQRCVTRSERRRVVRFTAIDRVRLIGVLLGSGPRAIVLAHQGGGGGEDLCVWMPYARSLARAGYRVLAFDHRGRGSSGQASSVSRLTRVDYDVLGALRVLRARGARAIVLAGGSLGGAAVIAAGAVAKPPVQGVISFASPTSFGRVDALAAARNLEVPALFLSADRDEGFPEAAQALYDATPSGDKRIWVFPGTRHGAPVLRDQSVKQYVDGWIRDHLPGA
jgi:dienelactone hydrolase